MSTNVGEFIVDATDERRGDATAATAGRGTVGADARRRIDVTKLDARSVQEYARRNVDTERVSLEHRGARTYLVIEE